MNCKKMLLVMAVYAFLIGDADATCNFPSDLKGVWKHSFHGDVNFFLPWVFTMTVHKNKDVEFKCEEQLNQDTYMVVSPVVNVNVFANVVLPLRLAMCLQLTKLKNYLYRAVHLTPESYSLGYARISTVDIIASKYVCYSNTTVTRKEYNLLVKDGFINDAKIPCPSAIHGAINFHLNSSLCNGRSDICEEDKSLIQITSQSCPKNVFYSDNNTFVCLYHTLDDKSDVLWIYNMDTETDQKSTFRYVCLIYQANTTSFQGSQNPRFCDSTQTASSVSKGSSIISMWGTLIEGHFSECAKENVFTTSLVTNVQNLTTQRAQTAETTTELETTTDMSTQQYSTAKEELTTTEDIKTTEITTTCATSIDDKTTTERTSTTVILTTEEENNTTNITTTDDTTTTEMAYSSTSDTVSISETITKEKAITTTEDITTSNYMTISEAGTTGTPYTQSVSPTSESGRNTDIPDKTQSTPVNVKDPLENQAGDEIFTDELKNIVISASVGVFMILLFALTLSIVITCIRRGKVKAKKRRSARRRMKNEYRSYMEHIRQYPRTIFFDLNSHRRQPSPIRSVYSQSRGNSPQRSIYRTSSRSPIRTSSRRSSPRYTTSTPRDHEPEDISSSPITHAPLEEEIPRISTNQRQKRNRRIVIIDPRLGQNLHFAGDHRDNSTYFNPFSQESVF